MMPTIFPVRSSAARLSDSWTDERARGAHEAHDIEAPEGSEIVSPVPGRVLRRYGTLRGPGSSSAIGYGLILEDADGWLHLLAHLEAPPDVAQGARVLVGERLGRVGHTGNAQGPHLHYSIERAGSRARVNATRHLLELRRRMLGQVGEARAPWAFGAAAAQPGATAPQYQQLPVTPGRVPSIPLNDSEWSAAARAEREAADARATGQPDRAHRDALNRRWSIVERWGRTYELPEELREAYPDASIAYRTAMRAAFANFALAAASMREQGRDDEASRIINRAVAMHRDADRQIMERVRAVRADDRMLALAEYTRSFLDTAQQIARAAGEIPIGVAATAGRALSAFAGPIGPLLALGGVFYLLSQSRGRR